MQRNTAVAQSSPTRKVCRTRIGGEPSARRSIGTTTLRPSTEYASLLNCRLAVIFFMPTAPGASASLSAKRQLGLFAEPFCTKLPAGRTAS